MEKRYISKLSLSLSPLSKNKLLYKHSHKVIKKGKSIPLQAWTGPEGSRRLRLPDFKTIGT
jgi:hypothetical protein